MSSSTIPDLDRRSGARLTAPPEGGATAVADGPTVLEALPPGLVERFERQGWLLTRSYNDEIGASFAEAFGTRDRAAVERYCRANMIETARQADGGLRTRQRRTAVVPHPATGRRCWFDHVAFLSRWTFDPDVRDYPVEVYGDDALPFDTRFGNGNPIGEDVVALLNDVYEAHTFREPWQPGDLLLVDNIRTAHSREPYSGPREVLVGMADPVRLAGGAPGGGAGDRHHEPRRRHRAGARRAAVRGDPRDPGAAGAGRPGEARSWRWSRPPTGGTPPVTRSTRPRTSCASRTARPRGSSRCPPRSAARSGWTG